MNEVDFQRGVAAVRDVYPQTRLLPPQGTARPLRVAPVPIPAQFWDGGTTRLLVVFDLANHHTTMAARAGRGRDDRSVPGAVQ
jgi:hypothetical protein